MKTQTNLPVKICYLKVLPCCVEAIHAWHTNTVPSHPSEHTQNTQNDRETDRLLYIRGAALCLGLIIGRFYNTGHSININFVGLMEVLVVNYRLGFL